MVLAIMLSFLVSMASDMYAASCTEWQIYDVEDNCDKSSGICTITDWRNVNYRTDKKKRVCIEKTGAPWFEYTQTTYKHGCCE